MNNDNTKFPTASDGIRSFLKMDPQETVDNNALAQDPADMAQKIESVQSGIIGASEPAVKPPIDLPIATPENTTTNPDKPNATLESDQPQVLNGHSMQGVEDMAKEVNAAGNFGSGLFSLFKKVLPLLAIFVIGLGLYYFYFSDFSFSSLLNSNTLKIESVTQLQTDKNLETLKNDLKSDYDTWIKQFFVDVNDSAIIDMDADVSGNGLTNIEKYLLNLNPTVYSTRGNLSDGQCVIEGTNPWTGKAFTDKQKALIEKYINKENISNRITAAALTRGVTKYAQYVNSDSPYYIDPQTIRELQATNPVITTPGNSINNGSQPVSTAPSNIKIGDEIDQSVPGLVEIPAQKVSVPLIWTQDTKNFDSDLKKGVVHYPGTAMPGEVGTAYISGHSSGYLWDKSSYKQVFAVLGNVKDGTSFSITATQKNGKKIRYNYVVQRRGEYAADDQAQFASTAESVVALSTCWPLNTTARRLVIFGVLTQTENL